MGISSDCVRNFLNFFKDHQPTFPKSDSRTMSVGGKRYAYDDFESIRKLISAESVLKYKLSEWWDADTSERMEWFTNFVEGTFRQEMVEKRRAQADLKSALRGNGKSDLLLPDASYILMHLQPFRVLGDVRREAGVKFLDTKTHQITDYDFYSIQAVLKAEMIDKSTTEQFLNRILHVRELYDPFNKVPLRLIENSNSVYEVNRHITPKWRGLDVKAELPADVDKLMRHLFPEESCRYFVYSWIYNSLANRSGTYLYLCGGQAAGKNTLATLIASLHGWENTSNPKQDSLVGRFNQYLKFKRFIFFDEFNCRSRKDKDTLKLIINDRIQIEGKGKDHEDVDIYASFFLANNSLEAIGLDPIDRRFSVPNTTWDSIIPAYGREWVQDFSRRIKSDHEMIAAFGNWILQEFKDTKWSPEEPYQAERFNEIVRATARQGISEMLERVMKKEQNSYDYYEERESFRRVHKGLHYPPIQDWTKFFQTVKIGGLPLGSVDGRKFTPRREFQRAPDEESLQ